MVRNKNMSMTHGGRYEKMASALTPSMVSIAFWKRCCSPTVFRPPSMYDAATHAPPPWRSVRGRDISGSMDFTKTKGNALS